MYYCHYTIYSYNDNVELDLAREEFQRGDIFVAAVDYINAIRYVNSIISSMTYRLKTDFPDKGFLFSVTPIDKCDCINKYKDRITSTNPKYIYQSYKSGDVFIVDSNNDPGEEEKSEMKLEQISEAKVLENLANGFKVFRMKLDDYSIVNLEEKSIKTIKRDMESETKYLYFALFE